MCILDVPGAAVGIYPVLPPSNMSPPKGTAALNGPHTVTTAAQQYGVHVVTAAVVGV